MKKEDGNYRLAPLWVADALMFLGVFFIALPNMRSGEPMAWQTALCCAFLVFISMCAMLGALWLDNKAKAKKAELISKKSEEESEIIFTELATLRDMIADLVEKTENLSFAADEAKQNAETIKKTNERISVIEDGINLLRDSVKDKFKEVSAEFEKTAKRADDISAKNCASLKKELADFNVDFLELKESFATFENSIKRDSEDINERLKNLDSSLEELASKQESAELDNADEGAEQAQLQGVLSRALSSGNDVAETVKKFVQHSKPIEESQEENQAEEVFAEGGEILGEEPNLPDDEQSPELTKTQAEPDAPEPKPIQDIWTDLTEKKTLQELVNEPSQEAEDAEKSSEEKFDGGIISSQEDNEDFFESANLEKETDAPRFAKQKASGKTKTSKPKAEQDNFLFDDMPFGSPQKVRPTKRDGVVVVNALIGIGNTPYLRGTAGGLSPDKGEAMQYLEIGKWRYVLAELDSPTRVRVLKNDQTPPEGEAEFEVSAGQTLELNLNFPISENEY